VAPVRTLAIVVAGMLSAPAALHAFAFRIDARGSVVRAASFSPALGGPGWSLPRPSTMALRLSAVARAHSTGERAALGARLRDVRVAGPGPGDPSLRAAPRPVLSGPPWHRHRRSLRRLHGGRSGWRCRLRGVGGRAALHLHRPFRRRPEDVLLALRRVRPEGRSRQEGSGDRPHRPRPSGGRHAASALRRPDRLLHVHRPDAPPQSGQRGRAHPPGATFGKRGIGSAMGRSSALAERGGRTVVARCRQDHSSARGPIAPGGLGPRSYNGPP
jgi:hypothetical protein